MMILLGGIQDSGETLLYVVCPHSDDVHFFIHFLFSRIHEYQIQRSSAFLVLDSYCLNSVPKRVSHLSVIECKSYEERGQERLVRKYVRLTVLLSELQNVDMDRSIEPLSLVARATQLKSILLISALPLLVCASIPKANFFAAIFHSFIYYCGII